MENIGKKEKKKKKRLSGQLGARVLILLLRPRLLEQS